MVAIAQLKPGAKKVHARFIVLERLQSTATAGKDTVTQFWVSDQSGSINLCVFNEDAQKIRPGDVLTLSNGYCSLYRKFLQLYVSPKGELEKIDEFCMMYSERPNLSKSEWQVDGEVPSTGPVALREVGGGGGGGGGGSSRNRY